MPGMMKSGTIRENLRLFSKGEYMRRFLLALFVFATSALAADFNGNWSGNGLAQGESHPLYFVLKQDGAMLTGTGGPSVSEQHPFQNGKVEGDKISFDVPIGEKGTLHFDLAADGNDIKGTVEVRREGETVSGTVSLKKEST
jgi:hypothetical protein